MGVELVGDENPTGVGVGINRLSDVIEEVLFFTGVADRRGDNCSRGDREVANQTLGAVANVFKLDFFDAIGSHRACGFGTLFGLYTGHFIGAYQVDPSFMKLFGF